MKDKHVLFLSAHDHITGCGVITAIASTTIDLERGIEIVTEARLMYKEPIQYNMLPMVEPFLEFDNNKYDKKQKRLRDRYAKRSHW